MDRDRSALRDRDEDRHRRRRHDSHGHHRHHHQRDAEDGHRHRRHAHDEGVLEEDRRRGARRRRSHSPSDSPPAAKRERSSRAPLLDSVARRDSADRGPLPPSRKRKGHGSGGDESCREGGKRARASAVAPSADPVPSKVSLIATTNNNGGVGIRSDEFSGNSSADGTTNSSAGRSSNSSLDALAKAKKTLQLRKELSEKLKKFPALGKLCTTIPDTQIPGTSSELTVPQRPAKAPVLRLDAQGREIDEHGNVISITKPSNLSTLKVNINKQKKDAFQIVKPDLESLARPTAHFDERMGINPTKLLRPRRPGFQFIEEGKLSRQAELQRIKNQFGEAQAKELKEKQAQLAKANIEVDMNPNLIEIAPSGRTIKLKQKEETSDIEPWDSIFLISATYEDISLENLNMDKITIYVEHPEPLEPLAKPTPPLPQPLKLTKKEQKKLRTQRRLANEKYRQEMIRQGLLEPPKPKVKMSNLMKVLGAEATQGPTRMEMEIRAAAAEREQAHVDRNIARKLTPTERREKKEVKLFDDPNTLEYFVCVYRIRDLSHPQTRFKVKVNAEENRLTGAAVITQMVSIVVVEGGKKSIQRYNKLMLNRIDWPAAVGGEDDAAEEPDKLLNSCALVWQGSVVKPAFTRFGVHQCRSEAAAKKVFLDAKVPHCWDLAVNFLEDSS